MVDIEKQIQEIEEKIKVAKTFEEVQRLQNIKIDLQKMLGLKVMKNPKME